MSILTEFSTECIGDRHCVSCEIHYPDMYLSEINTENLGISLKGLSDRQKTFAVTHRIMEFFAGLPIDALDNEGVLRVTTKQIFLDDEVRTSIHPRKEHYDNRVDIFYELFGQPIITIEIT